MNPGKTTRLATTLIFAALATLCNHAMAEGTWITDANGCKVWNANPKANETVAWSGACAGGYAEGQGVLQWNVDGAPSSTFEGKLAGGKRSGHGIASSATGASVEGNFVDGNCEGKCVIIFNDGARYDGDFVAGKRTGKGTITFKNGNRYEGDFVDGKLTGKGVFTWSDGTRYEGDMAEGKPNGKGAIKLASGDHYEGDFVNGKRTGKGAYTWANGDRYEGDFIDGKTTGSGNFSKAKQSYSMKDDETHTGSAIKRDRIRADIPLDKTYAQLSEAEKNRFKAAYEPMRPGDEPPFPEHGLGPLYATISKANDKIQAVGVLEMAVTIDSTGTPTKIEVYRSPDPDLTAVAARIALLTKFKPAICSGQPCTMAFPFSLNIVNSF